MPYNQNIWDNIFLFFTVSELNQIDDWGTKFHYPKIIYLPSEIVTKMTDNELGYKYPNGKFRYEKIERLALHDNVSISNYSLQYLTNLEFLMVCNNNRVSDLAIKKLIQLKKLIIFESDLFLGYSLPKLKKLESLELSCTPNVNEKYLMEMTQLKELNIYCVNIINSPQLKSLYKFSNLRNLHLWNQFYLKSKDFLIPELIKLTKLFLINSVIDPDNFQWNYFPNLDTIGVDNKLLKISQFRKMHNLKKITFVSISAQNDYFWETLSQIPTLTDISLCDYPEEIPPKDKYPYLLIKKY